LNPVLLPLEWLLGAWESDQPGEGCFPSIKPFRYIESLNFSHVGQPVINFMFNAFHAETRKPMHRECGFIRMQPGTNRVAFIIAQNSGLVEIEEGELTAQRLELQSRAVARTSFAREPHVQQICRVFQLQPDGKLQQTVSMATDNKPLMQHLHIVYRRAI
uniref:THAP domain containing 4 n=1 Tax=Tetraodon nigroviridis TaxID=99883 RepID=H3DCS7_TETNG